MAFTVVTPTLAGAMFMAAFSTRASLTAQINEVGRYVAFDAAPACRMAPVTAAEREALRIPRDGGRRLDGALAASRMHADGTEGDEIDITGLPVDTKRLSPVSRGARSRWLRETDTRQVVINDDYLEQEPDVKVGSSITLKVGTTEHTYEGTASVVLTSGARGT
ncbi:MAG: hypothetical protein U0559_17555 [Anaerolineae bacterium]